MPTPRSVFYRIIDGNGTPGPINEALGDSTRVAITGVPPESRIEINVGESNTAPIWMPFVIPVDATNTPYVGVTATGSGMPNKATTSLFQFNSRSHHWARSSMSTPRFKFPSWWWQRTDDGIATQYREHNIGGNITYRAAVEYPAGTYTPIMFAGTRNGVATPGIDIMSDPIPVNIPDGAEFWVHTYGTSTWGFVYIQGDTNSSFIDRGNGEAFETATSGLADKTLTGGIIDSGSTNGSIVRPLAIVDETTKPSILFLTDGRGWAFDTITSQGYMGELERGLGPHFGYINTVSPSETLAGFRDNGTKRAALRQHCSHVIIAIGINSLRTVAGGGLTSEAALAEQQQVIAMFPNKRVLTTTLAPVSSTANGQTPDANASAISSYNNAQRSVVSGASGFIEISDAVENGRGTGRWIEGYTANGLHANPAGYTAIGSLTSSERTKISMAGFAADLTPNAFTFTPQTGVSVGAIVTSNEVSITGINANTTITITGGTYSINGGTFVATPGVVKLNDRVRVRMNGSMLINTPVSSTVTIGGVSGTFTVTTSASAVTSTYYTDFQEFSSGPLIGAWSHLPGTLNTSPHWAFATINNRTVLQQNVQQAANTGAYVSTISGDSIEMFLQGSTSFNSSSSFEWIIMRTVDIETSIRYRFDLNPATNNLRLRTVNASTNAQTTLANVSVPEDIVTNGTVCALTQFDGSTIRSKVWNLGSPEPTAWQVSYTDPDPIAGPYYAGVHNYGDRIVPTIFRFGIGIDGTPAPRNAS